MKSEPLNEHRIKETVYNIRMPEQKRRHLLERVLEVNRNIVGDMGIIKQKQRTVFMRRAKLHAVLAVCVTLCVILVGYSLYQSMRPSPSNNVSYHLSSSQQNGSQAPANVTSIQENYIIYNTPKWYAPASLNVIALTYKDIEVPNDIGFLGNVGLKYLDLSKDYVDTNHKNGPLYFDINSKKIISITDEIKSKLINKGIVTNQSEIFIDEYKSNISKIVFTVKNNDSYDSYYLNLSTSEYKKLPISLYGKTLDVKISSDFAKLLFSKPRKDNPFCDDVFLIDIASEKYINITKNESGQYLYDAYMYSEFSLSDKYIVFSIRNNNGTLGDGQTLRHVVYSIYDSKYYEFTGEITKFSENNKYLFYKANNENMVLDLTNSESKPLNQSTSFTGVGDSEFYVIRSKIDENFITYTLEVEDVRNGKVSNVASNVKAFTKDINSRYLYYYIEGSKELICTDISSKDTLAIAIDDSFLKEIENNKKDSRVVYNIYVNDEATELLLTYYFINSNTVKQITSNASTTSKAPIQNSQQTNPQDWQSIDKEFLLNNGIDMMFRQGVNKFNYVDDKSNIAKTIELIFNRKFSSGFWMGTKLEYHGFIRNSNYNSIVTFDIGLRGTDMKPYVEVNGEGCYISKDEYNSLCQWFDSIKEPEKITVYKKP